LLRLARSAQFHARCIPHISTLSASRAFSPLCAACALPHSAQSTHLALGAFRAFSHLVQFAHFRTPHLLRNFSTRRIQHKFSLGAHFHDRRIPRVFTLGAFRAVLLLRPVSHLAHSACFHTRRILRIKQLAHSAHSTLCAFHASSHSVHSAQIFTFSAFCAFSPLAHFRTWHIPHIFTLSAFRALPHSAHRRIPNLAHGVQFPHSALSAHYHTLRVPHVYTLHFSLWAFCAL